MAFPLTYHRITNSYFRTCSSRHSRSQVGFCVYTLCTISVRAEPTFERLRYSFGGDRPSQTAHLTVSPDQFHGRRLENQQYKGGIPRLPPPDLTAILLSLPPILYMTYRISVLSCSKAPWGQSFMCFSIPSIIDFQSSTCYSCPVPSRVIRFEPFIFSSKKTAFL